MDAPAPEPRLRPQPPPPTLRTRPPAPPHALQLQHLRGKAEACIILHAVHGLRVFNKRHILTVYYTLLQGLLAHFCSPTAR